MNVSSLQTSQVKEQLTLTKQINQSNVEREATQRSETAQAAAGVTYAQKEYELLQKYADSRPDSTPKADLAVAQANAQVAKLKLEDAQKAAAMLPAQQALANSDALASQQAQVTFQKETILMARREAHWRDQMKTREESLQGIVDPNTRRQAEIMFGGQMEQSEISQKYAKENDANDKAFKMGEIDAHDHFTAMMDIDNRYLQDSEQARQRQVNALEKFNADKKRLLDNDLAEMGDAAAVAARQMTDVQAQMNALQRQFPDMDNATYSAKKKAREGLERAQLERGMGDRIFQMQIQTKVANRQMSSLDAEMEQFKRDNPKATPQDIANMRQVSHDLRQAQADRSLKDQVALNNISIAEANHGITRQQAEAARMKLQNPEQSDAAIKAAVLSNAQLEAIQRGPINAGRGSAEFSRNFVDIHGVNMNEPIKFTPEDQKKQASDIEQILGIMRLMPSYGAGASGLN